MNYPQLTGEPNFVLIGVAAVFGLLVIIMVYYIFISKNASYQSKQYSQHNASLNIPFITDSNSNSNSSTIPSPSVLDANGSPIFTHSSTDPSMISNKNISQVFNIKENIYTLDDAPGVCGALGADVASIDQLIDAHKNGADWCNVGWTNDGLAAYPIQYSTWKTLQDNNPNQRNICGSTGINLARNDPNLLYGVNCYGVKPEPKGNEKIKQSIISDKQKAINAQIAQFQKNINAIGVVPFNATTWSA